MDTRGKRKEREGIVISDKAQKTILVRSERLTRHNKYGKVIKKFSKFKAHDENNEAKVGNKVLIAETRPISKDKRWRLVKIIK